MIMIPLPFVTAIFIAALMAREVMARSARYGWFIAFLGLLIFQQLLVGTRFGYGVDWLKLVQPISGAAIPPLAYLSFRRPQLDWKVLVHSLPLAIILGVIFGAISLLDLVLAANNLFYAGLLTRLGLTGSDGLHWLRLGRARFVMGVLWLVVAMLVISGLTDALIAYDFRTGRGDNTQAIAGRATVLALILLPLLLLWLWRRGAKGEVPDVEDSVFGEVSALMAREKLFMDPDINLTRLARRLSRPVRDVSRAINAATGQNVSQYVNGLRIEAACEMLRDSDARVTHILYDVGFNTKSNFNREFVRITGKTPSAWRSREQSKG